MKLLFFIVICILASINNYFWIRTQYSVGGNFEGLEIELFDVLVVFIPGFNICMAIVCLINPILNKVMDKTSCKINGANKFFKIRR